MSALPLDIKPIHPRFIELSLAPRRMSAEAAGYDLSAALDAPLALGPGERAAVPCGFTMAVPAGYEAQVRPRSGLALRHGVTVLNAPGTIDSDFRGEVQVILVNLGSVPFVVKPGERVAQLVIGAVAASVVRVVAELPASGRGAGGFGSTGR